MAHESFEDPEVAAVMNRLFVNVKVDREERPDLDQIYQTAHHMLSQRSGGWPLTMFLSPDGTPLFGGTSFPKTPRPRLAAKRAGLSVEPIGALLQTLRANFDARLGGFGAAPKFPHPADLELCLRKGATEMADITLRRMCEGGIYDQLGGGFCRYSVDAEWTIPHFEKMLYDNGPLLALYADLARVCGDRRFADVAHGIVDWMTREMRAPDGAFYSSLDADSEGDEGKFYVWSMEELRSLLATDLLAVAAPYYGLDGAPNFERHAWNLRVATPLSEVAAMLGIALDDAERRI